MILCNRVGDGLQQHRLTGAWRRDDETALTFAEWRHQIDDARRQIFGGRLHLQLFFRIQRRQVVKENFLARLVRRFEVDRLDFDQREITLAFFRRANLAANRVAGAQVKLAYLRRRDVNVVWTRQIVVLRRPEEAEPIRQGFQHTFREDETALFRLGGEYFEDELLLTHARSAGHIHALGNLRELGDGHLLEIGQVMKALVFTVRSEEHTSELQSLAYLVCRLL